MSFRNSLDLRRVTCGCLLLAGSLAWAAAEERADPCGTWRDVGTLLLNRSGPGQRAAVAWLDRRWAFLDPDSGQAVATAEALLKEAFEGYAHDHIAVVGRVPLDANPQCLLGLYLARRFPDMRLGDWGQKRFEGCIEQSCMTATPQAGAAWRTECGSCTRGPRGCMLPECWRRNTNSSGSGRSERSRRRRYRVSNHCCSRPSCCVTTRSSRSPPRSTRRLSRLSSN